MSSLAERIGQLANNEGISIFELERVIGASKGTVYKAIQKNTDIQAKWISKIVENYTLYSPDWLLTGSGEMIRSGHQPNMIPATPETGIPLIPVDAMAGWLTGEVQFSPDDIAYYNLPNFRGADFIIRVKNDSMEPRYYGGDLVVCKKLYLSDLFFQWGKVYVLDTSQGALIKRIEKGESNDTITLVSENERYAPFELHRSYIHNVSLVLGIIREE